MPELPEVQTVANELNHKLKNLVIAKVEVNAPKMVSLGPGTVSNKRQVSSNKVRQFIKSLVGLKILSVRRRAKLLMFVQSPSPAFRPPVGGLRAPSPSRAEGKNIKASFYLLVHLKMTGQFIFEDQNLKAKTGGKYRMFNKINAPLVGLPGKHTHVIFYFTDHSKLYFNDIRQFGYLKLVGDHELAKVKELLGYGPEPLDKKFTLGVFIQSVKKRGKGKIKSVLMDPKVVAGIGNIYSDEILFHAKVRPSRQVSSIRRSEFRNIYRNISKVLTKAIAAKGSSVGDFVRTDGSWGQMGKFHFVYGRKGQKCKKCGTIIQSLKLNGRTGSFCPRCQK